jgi:hypothetical protein
VTVNGQGSASNDLADFPSISDDGNFVAFSSFATDLVDGGDAPGKIGVFLRDRKSRTTHLLSRGFDGRPADGASIGPQVSGDGRFVVFESDASNLAPPDANKESDVFLVETATKRLERVSGKEGGFLPAVSVDGRYVAYVKAPVDSQMAGARRIGVVLVDRKTKEVSTISLAPTLIPVLGNSDVRISADGLRIAYGAVSVSQFESGVGLNRPTRIAVCDRAKKITFNIPLPPEYFRSYSGMTLGMSPDGRYVCATPFEMGGTKQKQWVRRAGHHVVFDLQEDRLQVYEVRSDGFPPNRQPYFPGVSGNGEFLVFSSGESDLVPHEALKDQLYVVGLKKYLFK